MIKFALAVPCHNFIENAFDVFEQHNRLGAMLDFETYSLEEVIVTEQNAETITIDADVIITRGLLAEILKSIQGDIPVVEIQVPATDTLRVVLN
ncbi:MAG: PrpR N-terminal domain-containing protein, partial [[Clostridium] symbiosum]